MLLTFFVPRFIAFLTVFIIVFAWGIGCNYLRNSTVSKPYDEILQRLSLSLVYIELTVREIGTLTSWRLPLSKKISSQGCLSLLRSPCTPLSVLRSPLQISILICRLVRTFYRLWDFIGKRYFVGSSCSSYPIPHIFKTNLLIVTRNTCTEFYQDI